MTESNGKFRWRYVAPNVLTAVGLCLGLTSVHFSLEGRYETAAWLIVWCVLLDKADGLTARLLKASTSFGEQFDSFSDLVTFGIAPALLVYCVVRGEAGSVAGWPLLSPVLGIGLFVLAAAVRLARFNCTGHVPGHHNFVGIPTTLCGAIASCSMLVVLRHTPNNGLLFLFPLLLVLLGLGMVSNMAIPKLRACQGRVFQVMQAIVVVFTYVSGFAMVNREYLMGISWAWLVLGMGHYVLFGRGERSADTTAGRDWSQPDTATAPTVD